MSGSTWMTIGLVMAATLVPVARGVAEETLLDLPGIPQSVTPSFFRVSPEEAWAVVAVDVFRQSGSGSDVRVCVVHLPTGRKWDVASDAPAADLGNEHRLTFSADGLHVRWGNFVLRLDPAAEALRWEASAVPKSGPLVDANPPFLGAPDRLACDGKASANGREVQIEVGGMPPPYDPANPAPSSTGGKEAPIGGPRSRLTLRPSGVSGEVEDTAVRREAERAHAAEMEAYREQVRQAREEMEKIGAGEAWRDAEALGAMAIAARVPVAAIPESPALSPDGRWLACSFRTSAAGIAAWIALDAQPFVALPFAREMIGPAIWSRDSRHVYYMVRIDRPDGPPDHRLLKRAAGK